MKKELLRPLVGRRIGGKGKYVDPWGVELGLHKDGNCWTWRHDVLKGIVAADVAAAGLDCLVEASPCSARTSLRRPTPRRASCALPSAVD